MENVEYIIVQAGGKGTRLEELTANKPKCLVPVNNLPMLFHLFEKFPDKRFIIIGDYKFDVLKRYLEAFAKVKYILINSNGKIGTCAGIKASIKMLPQNKPFLLIWSDLILPTDFKLPGPIDCNYIGISKDFKCRWSYIDNECVERPSERNGIAGFFIFKDKTGLENVPDEGEFVRWLQGEKESGVYFNFEEIPLFNTREYGLISEYKKTPADKCRPFNRMKIEKGKLIKEGIDEQGKILAEKEKEWYKYVDKLGFKSIPNIFSFNPLTMEVIEGKNIYEYKDLDIQKKKRVLNNIVNILKHLHSLESSEPDYFSMKEAYATKTWRRLSVIRDLIPFSDKEFIIVNGKKCHNVFFVKDKVDRMIEKMSISQFKLLHGDCTFSNMMLRENLDTVLIDPRGYFGYTKFMGDPAYDWAKVYYSLVGNYDMFNLKKFRLYIGKVTRDENTLKDGEIRLDIESNGWEELEEYFFQLLGDEADKEQIRFIHAIIWLSLTTYAWEDFDSICGAFYNGLYYLEDVLA